MPRQHWTNFPDIAREKSQAYIEQKDKILRNADTKSKKGRKVKVKIVATIAN